MNIKRGDIFYADLSPVVGSEQGGIRPVLIVQNNVGNRFSPTVIAAAITSQKSKANLPTDVYKRQGMDLAEVTQHVVTGGKLGALPRMEGKLVTYSLDVPVIQRNLVEQRLDNALYGEEIQTVAAIKAADQLVLFYRCV